ARVVKGKRVASSDGSFTVSGKAANGEGSLYRERDGTWRATYKVPGEPRPRRVRGRTRDEAMRRRDEAMAKALEAAALTPSGAMLSASTTVAQFCQWWLANVARHRVRASSLGKYEDRVARITGALGEVTLRELRPEQIAAWQTQLLETLGPHTVADTRSLLRTIIEEAVTLELVATNPVTKVRPPRIPRSPRRALHADEARALVATAADDRLGAAVALLFIQGWRVSEVLGLAWGDLDLDAGIAELRRACSYADGLGMVLGPPKTEGAIGRHHLTPVVVELLRRRRHAQRQERLKAGDAWQRHRYDGEPIELVFTTTAGGLLLRQTVAKSVRNAALAAGIDPRGLSTHTGRSTAITVLYTEEGVDLADIARHVGHANPTTTAGYVRHLGNRPVTTTQAAGRLLDPILRPAAQE
ncbi:MAG: tyrosine-type recombinase/integrase, partial [Acidimicrobiia bacterium]